MNPQNAVLMGLSQVTRIDRPYQHLRAMNAMALCAIGLLLAGELGLSWMGFGSPLLYRASADPLDLGQYEPVPNQNVMRLGRQTRINSLGTRGREVERQSKQGAYRILVLGDSVTNGGTLVNDAETYPAQLESKLREAGCPAEVLNASAGGWSVFNEAGWLRAQTKTRSFR